MNAPAWQTDDLAEEWIDHSTSPRSDGSSRSPTSFDSTRKSFDSTKYVARGTGMRVVSGHTTFPSPLASIQTHHKPTHEIASPPASGSSASSSPGAGSSLLPAGTFLVKPDDAASEDGPKRNPFVGAAAAEAGLFQRLELERMFDPPPGGSPQEPQQPLDSPRESVDPVVPLRRTSHSYVPARPSRLSNSMTPSAGELSSSSGDVSGSVLRRGSPLEDQEDVEGDQQQQQIEDEYDSRSESSSSFSSDEDDDNHPARPTRHPIRRFSGEPRSMRDVEFTFTPSPIRKRASAQTLRTHDSRSSGAGGSPVSAGKKPPFKLFQRHVDPDAWDSVRSRDLIGGIVVGGTPLRDLVSAGSPSPRTGYIRGVRLRVDSGVSRGTSTRGRHGLLAKQWSTSSGSPGSGSGTEAEEERSAKRIRLSTEGASLSVEGDNDGDDDGRREEYGYSASGSEDAVDQRSFTASLNASHSRINRSADYSRREAFPVEVSSASEAPEEAVARGEKRTSWGEKGQELLARIRDVGTEKSDSWNSWSRSSPGVEEKSRGTHIAALPGIEVDDCLTASASPPAPPPAPQYGTVTSSNSGGTTSSNNTITSRYLSAGITMLEKIKERKVSDSSGTGVCTDADGAAARQNQPGPRARVGPESRDSTTRGTASSQSTVRPAGQTLAQGGSVGNGTARSAVSASSSRSSNVASLGKGTAPNLRTLVESVSDSPQPSDEPDQPGSRLARSQQEDMNRYISSTSTANTATTAVSTSFVKHRGPPPPTPHGRAQGVRTIGLNDIPQIPHQVGNMVFDPARGWVKARAPQTDREASPMGGEGKSSSAESVDIFAGMESLRDEELLESAPEVAPRRGHLSPVLEVSMSHLREDTVQPAEMDVAERSVAQQEPATTLPTYPPGWEEPEARAAACLASLSLDETPKANAMPRNQPSQYIEQDTPERPIRPELRESISAPTPLQTDPLQSTPAVRSILKVGSAELSAIKANPATPMSAVKIAVPEDSARRSVSFSDGRTHGKILEHNARQAVRKQRNWSALAPEDDIFNSQDGSNGEQSLLPMQPSVRSKRIQNMLTDLSGNGKSRVMTLRSVADPCSSL